MDDEWSDRTLVPVSTIRCARKKGLTIRGKLLYMAKDYKTIHSLSVIYIVSCYYCDKIIIVKLSHTFLHGQGQVIH